MNITQQSRMLIRNYKILRFVQISRTCSQILKSYPKVVISRNFCSVFSKSPDYTQDGQLIDISTFEPICTQTLEALTDYFEEIVDADGKLINGDVSYSVSKTCESQNILLISHNLEGRCTDSETWKRIWYLCDK